MKTSCLTLGLVFLSVTTASAQVVVHGNGEAKSCYEYAKFGDMGTDTALRSCTRALNIDMDRRDEAATYTNRGVLLMRKGDYVASRVDYERAIKLQPKMDQAYINYGATLFSLGESDLAMNALNTAITMDTSKMPEALYNRSLVYHKLGDYKSAYYDLKEALVIRPDWVPAQTAIARYDVKPRT